MESEDQESGNRKEAEVGGLLFLCLQKASHEFGHVIAVSSELDTTHAGILMNTHSK